MCAVPEGSQEPLQQKGVMAQCIPGSEQQADLQQAAYGKRQKFAIWKQGVAQVGECSDNVITITASSFLFSQTEHFREYRLKSKIN